MRRRVLIGLLTALLIGAASSAAVFMVARVRGRRMARADAAACLVLDGTDRAACARAAEREAKEGRVRAAVDYLLVACDEHDPATAHACERLEELRPQVTDHHCNILDDGPDAEGLTLRAVSRHIGQVTLCVLLVDEKVPDGVKIPDRLKGKQTFSADVKVPCEALAAPAGSI